MTRRLPYLAFATVCGLAAWWFYNDPRAIEGTWIVLAAVGVVALGMAWKGPKG